MINLRQPRVWGLHRVGRTACGFFAFGSGPGAEPQAVVRAQCLAFCIAAAVGYEPGTGSRMTVKINVVTYLPVTPGICCGTLAGGTQSDKGTGP
jgi:hypothetical protein